MFKPYLLDFSIVERVLCSNLSCSTLVKLFTFDTGNFLNDFSKVVLILILWLSSLPGDLIAERAFPMFNENQSIMLTLTA